MRGILIYGTFPYCEKGSDLCILDILYILDNAAVSVLNKIHSNVITVTVGTIRTIR